MLMLYCILIPAVIGCALMFWANRYNLRDYRGREQRITWSELALGAGAIVLLAFTVTQVVGPNLARSSAIKGYHEFRNGSVTEAVVIRTACHKDGSCSHEYDCDPYTVTVVDSPGTSTTPPRTHEEKRYHDCPFVTAELDYVLFDSLGRRLAIGDNYFEPHPHQWSGERGIPDNVPREVPTRWTQVKQDLANGLATPVTGVFPYENYILASDSKLYEQYGGNIEKYQKAGLLPKHTANLGDGVTYDYGMQAQKVQAVGGLKVNLSLWQDRLMRFNAALGSAPNRATHKDFQGDMHVVMLPASKVSNPDEYINALKAYWTHLGKWSISKNGIVLAIGVSDDGSTVAWSRATTGMPYGNNTMTEALKLRPIDLPLNPDILFGNTKANVKKTGNEYKVGYDLSSTGAIGKIVFQDYPFMRACMKCESKGDSGSGFVNLKDEVPISTGAKFLMFGVILIMSVTLWLVFLWTDVLGLLTGNRNTYTPQQPFGF